MDMKLEDHDKLLLIRCIQERPAIWDPQNGNHNRNRIAQAYNEIVEELATKTGRKFTVDSLRNGWRCLCIYFRKVVKEYLERKRSEEHQNADNDISSTIGPDPAITWRFFEPMQFLMPVVMAEERKETAGRRKRERKTGNGNQQTDWDAKTMASDESSILDQSQQGLQQMTISETDLMKMQHMKNSDEFNQVRDACTSSTLNSAGGLQSIAEAFANSSQLMARLGGFDQILSNSGNVEKQGNGVQQNPNAAGHQQHKQKQPIQVEQEIIHKQKPKFLLDNGQPKSTQPKKKRRTTASNKSNGVDGQQQEIDQLLHYFGNRDGQNGLNESFFVDTQALHNDSNPAMFVARHCDESDFFGMQVGAAHRKYLEKGQAELAVDFYEAIMQQLIAFDRRSIQLLGEPTNSQMQAQPKEDEEQRKEQDQTTLTVGEDATENTE